MKKLIASLTLLLLGISNTISVNAETISWDGNYDGNTEITFVNFFSDVYGYEMRANRTDFGGDYVSFKVPTTDSILYEDGGIKSSIIFYQGPYEEGSVAPPEYITEVDVDDLEDQSANRDFFYGEFFIDLNDYLTEEEIEKLGAVKITLMTNFESPPSAFSTYLENNVAVTFTDTPDLPTVEFIHQGEVLYETTYIGFIDPPPNEPLFVDGYAFDYWVDQEGDIVNFNDAYDGNQKFYSVGDDLLSIQYYENDVFKAFDTVTRDTPILLEPPTPSAISGQEFLWWEMPDGSVLSETNFYTFQTGQRINAVYREITEAGITAQDPGDQPFNSLIVLLEGFGLNNQFGYIVVMLLAFVPINLFLAYVNIGTVPIAISNFGLIGLFLYLQFMPFWFVFILIFAVVAGIIGYSKGVIQFE